jgi:hypothetical protein
MSAPADFPPVGSFPGFSRLLSAFSHSLSIMNRQANDWNAAWASVREGKFSAKDLGKLFVSSVEAPVELWSQWWLPQPNAADADVPVWATLPWGGPPEDLEVRLRQPLDEGEEIAAGPLSPLGGQYPHPSTLPTLEAERLNEYAIKIRTIGGSPPPGEYIGFVKSAKRTSPLVIVSVTVPGRR